MDVPARQTYVAVVVACECVLILELLSFNRLYFSSYSILADERSAAGGITNIVRSLGMSAAPIFVGLLSEHGKGGPLSWFAAPWYVLQRWPSLAPTLTLCRQVKGICIASVTLYSKYAGTLRVVSRLYTTSHFMRHITGGRAFGLQKRQEPPRRQKNVLHVTLIRKPTVSLVQHRARLENDKLNYSTSTYTTQKAIFNCNDIQLQISIAIFKYVHP